MISVSVRNLVEFIFRSGDIDNRAGRGQSPDAMLEGSRIHRKIQNSMGTSYQAEVPLKYVISYEDYDLVVEGRADGIFSQDGTWWIDEIKGMYRHVENFKEPIFVHEAQAMCYAYIYARDKGLEEIGVQMTYVNLETEDIKRLYKTITFVELESWFNKLIEEYKKWSDFEFYWKLRRDASIRTLNFPFEYREGQKELVSDVYRTISRRKKLFLQAPTGVGKTISTVFPSVKAVGEGLADHIFYLTAKTITAQVARETFELMMQQGYEAKTVNITAKEKLCFCDEMDCNPVNCPYAKGHYDRVNDAVFDLLQKKDLITREDIEEQAGAYEVCPFEMCLDVSSWCDNIICDYNYVFDPHVYLKRFFADGTKGDYIFLVDEAHNLVDRSRQMYSAELYKEDFLVMKKILKQYSAYLEKLCENCNKKLLAMKRECEEIRIYSDIGGLHFALMRLATELDEFLRHKTDFTERKDVTEFYFNLRSFLEIYEFTDTGYVIYSEQCPDGRFMLRLFCVDPSENLEARLTLARSTVFFSATLLPIRYYKRLLSTDPDNYAVYAHSVFSPDQSLILFGRDVGTKYTERGPQTYEKIAEYILKTVETKQGNYMVFFPSYRLMADVGRLFEKKKNEGTRLLYQTSKMNEAEREEFLGEFEKDTGETLVAFCVTGGIFGEGIDLKEERLIGAVVVGTGLPQVSKEQELLKDYYDREGENGFDYAYRFPGLNKVLQSAGRVIRTKEDRGIILLLDKRFLSPDYKGLFPREWEHSKLCDLNDLSEQIREFWNKEDN